MPSTEQPTPDGKPTSKEESAPVVQSTLADQPRGLPRRTVVAGAAWSLPVIAMAVATPLASASVTPRLTFLVPPQDLTTCAPETTAILQLTTNGSMPAPAGSPITVTLPDGLVWADGGTNSRVLLTDSAGQVHLNGADAITADPAPSTSPGTYDIVANAPGVLDPAVATIVLNQNTSSWYVRFGLGQDLRPVSGDFGQIVKLSEIGGGITAFALNSDGEVFITNPSLNPSSATQVTSISGATDVAAWHGGVYGIVAASGTAYTVIDGQAYQSAIPVSAGIEQVAIGNAGAVARGADGSVYFYDPSGAATSTPPAVLMAGLPAGGATDIDAFIGAGFFTVAVGADGRAYISLPQSQPQNSFAEIPGSYGTVTEARVTAGQITLLNGDGELWQVEPNGAPTTEPVRVGDLDGVSSFDSWWGDGRFISAISNGRAYLHVPGQGWREATNADDLTEIVIGNAYSAAIDTDGVVYQQNHATPAELQILGGVSNATHIETYDGNGTLLSVAAVKPVC